MKTKMSAVFSRMREICKEDGSRLVCNCKMASPGNMYTDGKNIYVAHVDTFPSPESAAISFCHELGHKSIWKDTKKHGGNGMYRNKFEEEVAAWSIGITIYYDAFRGLHLRSFSKNYPLRRFVVQKLATYAGMFNMEYEGFYGKNNKPIKYRCCKPIGTSKRIKGEGK